MLLTLIETIFFGFEERHNLVAALGESKDKYYKLKQGPVQRLQVYYEKIVRALQLLSKLKINIVDTALLMCVAAGNGRVGNPNDADQRQVQDLVEAMRFVQGCSNYPAYIIELHNDQVSGHDNYPKSPGVW